jgi:DNA invertase Pin-like site-specific DNA recombinase
VIIWSLDQLGSTITMVLERIERLHKTGAALIICKEDIDTTTPAGHYALSIFGALAAIESSGPSHNTPKVENRGKIPYGYRRFTDPASGALLRIEVADKQSKIVNRIFELHDKGLTLQAIANDVQSRGNSPRGAGWSATAVRRILKNEEKYRGKLRGPTGEPWPVILDTKEVE